MSREGERRRDCKTDLEKTTTPVFRISKILYAQKKKCFISTGSKMNKCQIPTESKNWLCQIKCTCQLAGLTLFGTARCYMV